MHTFTDIHGAEWTLDINVDARNQVKASVPTVDFYDVDCITRLSDKETLGAVLFVLVREQLEQRQKTGRDFFKGIKGDVWDRVLDAFHAELIDFFQSGERQLMRKALDKTRTLKQMALARANQVLDSNELEEKLRAKLNDLSTSSPASSESTPADSASEG